MIESKISVIVPVYNVENDLQRCIDSILNQTYKNIEVILINDGSKDNSGNICEKNAKNDSRILVIHKKNGGSSLARNVGLDVATGDYISFVDSDDFIDQSMLETMVSLAEEHNLEVVEIASKTITNNKKGDDTFKIEDSDEAFVRTIKNTSFSVWRRIYKKSLIGNLRFIPNIIHQDVFFSVDIINKVSAVGFLNSPLYTYNNIGLSVIRSRYSEHKIETGIRATEYLKSNLSKSRSVQKALRDYIVYYYTDHYFLLSRNADIDPKKTYRSLLKKDIIKNINFSNLKLRQLLVILMPAKLMELISSKHNSIKRTNS